MIVLFLGPREHLEVVQRALPASFSVRHAEDGAGVDALAADCHAVLDASLTIPFSAERVHRAKNLQLYVVAATGADHVDADALAARGIRLWTLRDQPEVIKNITAAAEHSWLLLMACARGLPSARQAVLEGRWDRQRHPGTMLQGKTLGIVGCGRIGQWMARYGQAFGMRCLGYDPYVSPWPDGIVKSTLDELLRGSDFITVHVPLSAETRSLLGRTKFEQMKHGVVVINTSRGDVVDEMALLASLREGRVAAAGLDVLSGEPDIAGNPLVEYARDHPNLVITPHIGGYSPDALRLVLTACCRRIREAFEDAPSR